MSYKYEENNKKYIIELTKNEETQNISIQIINELNLSEKYNSFFSLEFFQNKADIFKNKTISQIENILKQLIENKKYILLYVPNYINIQLNVDIPFVDTMKIILEIPKETLFTENQLKSIISPLTENLLLLKEKILKLEEKNEEIIQKLNLLQEENIQLKKSKTQDNKIFLFNDRSKIVSTEEEINFLKEIIPNSKFSLIYRATIDGDSFSSFRSKCNGVAPSIILFKTDKDKKWGAYTDNPWKSTGGCDDHKDAKYFLFSITNEKKYIRKKGILRSICGRESIRFCDTMGLTKNSILEINGGDEDSGNSSRYENYVKDYEITGSKNFTCVETEVYKIEEINKI